MAAKFYDQRSTWHQKEIMKFFVYALMCFLLVSIYGCLDYVKINGEASVSASSLDNKINFPPIIDFWHLSPSPDLLTEPINVGKNCKGQIFKVPPIIDKNPEDKLYYLWFLDNKLAYPQSVIEPQDRKSAILTLNIDEQFLMSLFETRLPKDFFSSPQFLEFFVSNVPYDMPEVRYINESQANQQNYGDYVYWVINFSNDPC